MDQTINENEKYKGKILNFVQNAKSQDKGTKVRDGFCIVIKEDGSRVLQPIVPDNLIKSVERRCQEWGISHQVESVIEHKNEGVASIVEVASAEL